jgi:hypothetical protein
MIDESLDGERGIEQGRGREGGRHRRKGDRSESEVQSFREMLYTCTSESLAVLNVEVGMSRLA